MAHYAKRSEKVRRHWVVYDSERMPLTEACVLAGVSVQTVRNMVCQYEVPMQEAFNRCVSKRLRERAKTSAKSTHKLPVKPYVPWGKD